MKAVFVVLSLLLALAFAEDLRLIQLKEDEEPVWATEEERLTLVKFGILLFFIVGNSILCYLIFFSNFILFLKNFETLIV